MRAQDERMLEGFANLQFNLKRLDANGNTAVCECLGTAVYEPNGKHVALPLAVVMAFNPAGEVTRFAEYYDSAELKRQLQ